MLVLLGGAAGTSQLANRCLNPVLVQVVGTWVALILYQEMQGAFPVFDAKLYAPYSAFGGHT